MSDIMPNGFVPNSSWSDDDYSIFEHWIRGVLLTSKPEITFTKKDGSERVMKCTLKLELIPEVIVKENKKPKSTPLSTTFIIRVFDLEKQGWRSINVKTVKTVTISLIENDDIWQFPSGPKP